MNGRQAPFPNPRQSMILLSFLNASASERVFLEENLFPSYGHRHARGSSEAKGSRTRGRDKLDTPSGTSAYGSDGLKMALNCYLN